MNKNQIEIQVKPIDQMRYPSAGDYFYRPDGVLKFEIADTGDWFYNRMILIHELIEQTLTEKLGISEESITDFDLMFEKARQLGLRTKDEEPGFHNDAPYLREHTVATAVEMMMCAHAGIKWNEYSATVNEL